MCNVIGHTDGLRKQCEELQEYSLVSKDLKLVLQDTLHFVLADLKYFNT